MTIQSSEWWESCGPTLLRFGIFSWCTSRRLVVRTTRTIGSGPRSVYSLTWSLERSESVVQWVLQSEKDRLWGRWSLVSILWGQYGTQGLDVLDTYVKFPNKVRWCNTSVNHVLFWFFWSILFLIKEKKYLVTLIQ